MFLRSKALAFGSDLKYMLELRQLFMIGLILVQKAKELCDQLSAACTNAAQKERPIKVAILSVGKVGSIFLSKCIRQKA